MTEHMIFDVNIYAEFTRKLGCIADVHKIDIPPSMKYSSVVSRDSVRIFLMLESLDIIDLKCANVHHSYLITNLKEIVWLQARQEFGVQKGKVVVIIRALYGLKVDGYAWALELR